MSKQTAMKMTMNFKTTIEETPAKTEQVYPCYMQTTASKIVILMTSEGRGTVISTPRCSEWRLGHTSKTWDMKAMRPFTGKITIDCTGEA